MLLNTDGAFQAIKSHHFLAIPADQEHEELDQLNEALRKPGFKFQAVYKLEGATFFYANAAVGEDVPIFRTVQCGGQSRHGPNMTVVATHCNPTTYCQHNNLSSIYNKPRSYKAA
jgi:hypothetical protein